MGQEIHSLSLGGRGWDGGEGMRNEKRGKGHLPGIINIMHNGIYAITSLLFSRLGQSVSLSQHLTLHRYISIVKS